MKNKKVLALILVIGSLAIAVPVFANKQSEEPKVIKNGDKTICIVEDTKKILADNITVSKIDTYESILGYDWLDENQIIVSKENKGLKPIKTEIGEFEVQNLYSYDLNSKKEKSIADKSKCQTYAISSPDNKHIFYVNDFEKENIGYIVDSQGNIKLKINEPGMDMADLTEAYWINDEELIMPYSNIKGFYIVKIDGTSTKIENVEKEKMTTEDLLNGLSIVHPVKVGDKIYYRTLFKGKKKMKVYDVNTKETKEFIKDEVMDFQLSPDKQHFVMDVIYPDKQNNTLILTDLKVENMKILDEGYIFGENWSSDGKSVFYISNKEGKEGIYSVDIKTNKITLISKGEYYLPFACSPSSKKIMVHSTQEKDGKLADVTNIITLN